ncbi:hypothetical protein EDC01DRAFT_261713 [Geopyxis carbonaria]|nr:hypothetical protein EDC01DRAFT_261713 [Geopyxis carbonaria]
MRFTLATIAAAAAFFSSASAHLTMTDPPQWASVPETVTSGGQFPLKEDGSDFPCQSMAAEDVTVNYELGSSASLKLKGSAVHGGGSAQMVISYEFPPSPDAKKWRVLTSWEGGHPMSPPDANYPANPELVVPGDYQFKVHDFLPKGKAIVAWSWFNKVGNREHYMKCATVTIGGGKDEVAGAMDSAALKKLPTMFRANSGGPVPCTTPDGTDTKFPHAGIDVISGGSPKLLDCACQDAGTLGDGPNATPSDPSDTPTVSDTPAVSAAPVVSEPAAPSASAPAASSAYGATPTDVDNAAGSPDASAAPAAPSATAAPSTPAAPATGAACKEGAVVCNADGTWSQCGSGVLQNMGGTNGMVCKDGVLTSPSRAKRALRAHRAARRSVHRH